MAIKLSSLFLSASVSVNLVLVVNLLVGGGGGGKLIKLKSDYNGLSWSLKAAAEAEAVAAISCSGHGRAYLDGPIINGKHVCECNTCYSGPDCSQLSPNCVITGAITTPLDVIKTRLMVQGSANQYKSISHFVSTIIREEGSSAFFKGIGPRVLWIGIGGSIFFGVLERTKQMLAQKRALDQNTNSVKSD